MSTYASIEAPPISIKEEFLEEEPDGADYDDASPEQNSINPLIDERKRLKRLRKLKRSLEQANLLDALKRRYLVEDDSAAVVAKIEQIYVKPEQPEEEEDVPMVEFVHQEVKQEPTEVVAVEMETSESENVIIKEENSKKVESSICEVCGEQFPSRKNMLKHYDGYHAIPGTSSKREGKNVFECKFCELEFPLKVQLVRHCNQQHADQLEKVPKENPDDENSLPTEHPKACRECKAAVTSMKEYVSHLESNHAETYCDICYKVFRDPTVKMFHRRVHFGGNPFKCDLCPMVFKTLYHVAEHRRGHTGDKPYQCANCPNAFARVGDLNKHIKLRHTKEPSFTCPECGETFFGSSSFYNHKQKHKEGTVVGLGPVPTVACDLCGENFTNKNVRKEHILQNHPEGRPFECQDCGKRFKLNTHLKAHSLTHTGVKTQQCDQCPAAYYLPGDLRRHKKRHLKEELEAFNYGSKVCTREK